MRASELRLLGALTATLLVTLAAPAGAVDPQLEAARRGLAKAQQLLRQVATEKAAAEAGKAQLEAELSKLKKSLEKNEEALAAAEGELTAAQASHAALAARLDGTQSRLDTTKGQLDEVVAKYRQLATEHRDLTAAKAMTDDRLAFTDQELGRCEQKNVTLFEYNQDLLAQYRDKGVLDALAKREPFTGIKSVAIENILQEYRFKLEDATFERAEFPGAGEAPLAGAAAGVVDPTDGGEEPAASGPAAAGPGAAGPAATGRAASGE